MAQMIKRRTSKYEILVKSGIFNGALEEYNSLSDNEKADY